MEILAPEIFYRYLITNENFKNDFSLAAQNSYLDDEGNAHQYFPIEVTNQTGQWLENQINTMNTEEDDSEIIYGNFQYISAVIDEAALFPQYTAIYTLQLLGMEKYREGIIQFFDRYASQLNNLQDEIIFFEEDGKTIKARYDLVVRLGKLSTPEYGPKEDIGGCERFIINMPISVQITTALVTSKKIKLYHVYNNIAEDIPYIQFSLSRTNELVLDNKAGYEKQYDVNKSDVTLSLTAYYVESELGNAIMDYAIIPEKTDSRFVIRYVDLSAGIKEIIGEGEDKYTIYNREHTYTFCPSSVNIEYKYGQPVSYNVTFKNSYIEEGTVG